MTWISPPLSSATGTNLQFFWERWGPVLLYGACLEYDQAKIGSKFAAGKNHHRIGIPGVCSFFPRQHNLVPLVSSIRAKKTKNVMTQSDTGKFRACRREKKEILNKKVSPAPRSRLSVCLLHEITRAIFPGGGRKPTGKKRGGGKENAGTELMERSKGRKKEPEGEERREKKQTVLMFPPLTVGDVYDGAGLRRKKMIFANAFRGRIEGRGRRLQGDVLHAIGFSCPKVPGLPQIGITLAISWLLVSSSFLFSNRA